MSPRCPTEWQQHAGRPRPHTLLAASATRSRLPPHTCAAACQLRALTAACHALPLLHPAVGCGGRHVHRCHGHSPGAQGHSPSCSNLAPASASMPHLPPSPAVQPSLPPSPPPPCHQPHHCAPTPPPQGMSYANLAGLPYAFGLYGAFVPCIVYAFLGSSRQLVRTGSRHAGERRHLMSCSRATSHLPPRPTPACCHRALPCSPQLTPCRACSRLPCLHRWWALWL